MLNVDELNVFIDNKHEDAFTILRDISFSLEAPEILGILGESGSGKSVLAKTICGLTQPPLKTAYNEISFNSKRLVTEADFRSVRGKGISMIFQHPSSALNPVFTIGEQMTETILYHKQAANRNDAEKLSISLLEETGIQYPAERLHSYPHQLSGGMNQRVMTAMALAARPSLIIADEPTTALDVITQTQIINMLQNLRKMHNFAILFITHDLSLMEKIADRVIVLYAGEIMEIAPGKILSKGAVKHPCTDALKKCVPSLEFKGKKLYTIKGQIARNGPKYDHSCVFHERCPYAQLRCGVEKPPLENNVRCFFPL